MMANRSQSATTWQLPKDNVLSIDRKTLPEGTQVFRCHSCLLPNGKEQGSWFYSSGLGRFDLPDPYGTLNVAEERLGAVFESFGSLLVGRRWVRREEVDRRKLVALKMQSTIELTDLRSSSGMQAGVVPGELTGADDNYNRTQMLASAIHQAGRDGLAAPLRFGSAFRQDGFFIFGSTGQRHLPATEELSMNEALEQMGYKVVSAPPSSAITLKS